MGMAMTLKSILLFLLFCMAIPVAMVEVAVKMGDEAVSETIVRACANVGRGNR